jgi:hypothetical protein
MSFLMAGVRFFMGCGPVATQIFLGSGQVFLDSRPPGTFPEAECDIIAVYYDLALVSVDQLVLPLEREDGDAA